MEEVLIIRIANSDGSAFLSIINALQDKNLQILHAADLEPSTLTLGDIEIFPEQPAGYEGRCGNLPELRRILYPSLHGPLSWPKYSAESSSTMLPGARTMN